MKKEMIISILVGLFFGLIIVYGVYTAQTSLSHPPTKSAELAASPSPDSLLNQNGTLTVHSPEDETIVSEANLTVTGTTHPDSIVVIFINDEEFIATADETGHFSIEGELELGSNIIEIHTIDEDGQAIVEERTVVYTTKPLINSTEEETSDSPDLEQ